MYVGLKLTAKLLLDSASDRIYRLLGRIDELASFGCWTTFSAGGITVQVTGTCFRLPYGKLAGKNFVREL